MPSIFADNKPDETLDTVALPASVAKASFTGIKAGKIKNGRMEKGNLFIVCIGLAGFRVYIGNTLAFHPLL
jgi:hypothetical protein